jgi:hypothetical protein
MKRLTLTNAAYIAIATCTLVLQAESPRLTRNNRTQPARTTNGNATNSIKASAPWLMRNNDAYRLPVMDKTMLTELLQAAVNSAHDAEQQEAFNTIAHILDKRIQEIRFSLSGAAGTLTSSDRLKQLDESLRYIMNSINRTSYANNNIKMHLVNEMAELRSRVSLQHRKQNN